MKSVIALIAVLPLLCSAATADKEWVKRTFAPTNAAVKADANETAIAAHETRIAANEAHAAATGNPHGFVEEDPVAMAEIVLATNAIRRVDGAARPLPKYLHERSFDSSYPDEAKEYYRSRGDGKVDGGCSAVRDGGFLYRNFDYPFDERAEFVVEMSAGPGRFASVGVAQVGTNLTEEIVTSGDPKYSARYKWLPGATVDGINENGVVCGINVVDSPVAGWHTTGDLHPLGAIRWILDHATNACHGATYIAANIRFPAGWTQNFHYMVADAEKTYIVENGTAYDAYDAYFAPGEEPAVMTNFRLSAFPWGGMGLERFNLLMVGVSITNAWYTRAYRRETNPPWLSDLAEVLAYTNDIFDAWAAHPKEYFRGKTNNGITWWQTVHTSVYDLTNLVLRIAVQEQDDWYTFAVDQANVDLTPIEAQIAELQEGKLDKTDVVPASTSASDGAAAEAKTARHILDEKAYEKTYNDDWTITPGDGLGVAENYNYYGQEWSYTLYDVETVEVIETVESQTRLETTVNFPNTHVTATRTVSVSEDTAHSLSKRAANPATGALAKFDADKNLIAATPSSHNTPGDFRAPTDNEAHADSLADEWVANGVPEGVILQGQPRIENLTGVLTWTWRYNDDWAYVVLPANTDPNADSLTFEEFDSQHPSFTATRTKVATSGESFTTKGYVDGKVSAAVSTNNPAFVSAVRNTPSPEPGQGEDPPWGEWGTLGAAIAGLVAGLKWLKNKVFDSDGFIQNDFATELLGKQVAINAMRYALNSGATIQDRAINLVTMTDTRQTITLPSRIAGKTRDLILRVEVGDLATIGGIALALGSTELASWEGDALDFAANKNYLVTVTETKNMAATDAQDAPTFFVRVVEMTAQPTAA